jgi:cobalt-zinc-cadmium efflux system membrane fusion protein
MLKIRLLHAYILIGVVAAFYIGNHSKKLTSEAEAQENQENQTKIVQLDDTVLKEFDIQTDIAGPGKILVHKILPAEIAFNSDKLAHIVPRVPGVVCEVRKNVGENVKTGDILAVIESRELADVKAGYLGACEKLTLSEASFKREETLWQKKITAEQEYLDTKRTLADAKIELRSFEQKLHALGFSEQYLKELPNLPDESFIEYEIKSPINGTIVEKHIVLGEVLKEDSSPFVVADLSVVWCNLNVHQKDLPSIKTGQPVIVSAGKLLSEGTITYISSTVGEETRTALARVEIPNGDRLWYPGLFATGKIMVDDMNVAISVPKDAIVMLDTKDCVFIKTDRGFEPQTVTLGRVNDVNVEITSGLKAGQIYVAKGAFTIKSELNKPTEEE